MSNSFLQKFGWSVLTAIVTAVVTAVVNSLASKLPEGWAWVGIPFQAIWEGVKWVWWAMTFTVPFPLSVLIVLGLAIVTVIYYEFKERGQEAVQQEGGPPPLTPHEKLMLHAFSHSSGNSLSVSMGSAMTNAAELRVNDTFTRLLNRGYIRQSHIDAYGDPVYKLTPDGTGRALSDGLA